MPDFEALTGPAVWTGAELAAQPDFGGRWTSEEEAELRAALRRWDALPAEARAATQTATLNDAPALTRRLRGIRAQLEDGPGVAWLRGLPLEGATEDAIAALFWALASEVGQPVSQSRAGERLFRVEDAGLGQEDPRARGPNTRKGLSFHTDRCDVISFCCVRPAARGGTHRLASAAALHNAILARRPELLPQLYEPYIYKRHTVDHGNAWPFCEQPIFARHEGRFIANVMRVLILRAHACPEIGPLTGPKREALELLEALAREPGMHLSIDFAPGDLLFVNNFAALHSRDDFEDAPERRRLLLRIWLSVPNSRALPESFRAHYGEVAAGALRGGIHPPEGPQSGK